MIVKLGEWSRNKVVREMCERLLAIEGTSKKLAPQRCIIRCGNRNLAVLGVEAGAPVIEFKPRKQDYASAHGSRFVKPHSMQQLAREGWLQAHPTGEDEVQQLHGWIVSSAEKS